MVKQREGYKFVILEPAKTWLAEGKCAGCGKHKSEWTRSTKWKCCSTECTQKYMKDSTYYGWAELRIAAIKRDNFRCLKCGKHEKVSYEYKSYSAHSSWTEFRDHYFLYSNTYYIESIDEENKIIICHDPSKYVVDHIIPIATGGEEWSLENLQTLCKDCNKIKTKNDMGDIARLRIKEQFERAGQKFFEDI